MPNEVTSNATDEKEVVETKPKSESDYLASRMASLAARQAEKSATPGDAKAEPAAEPPKEEAKDGTGQESAPKAEPKEGDAKDVLSKVDLSELTDEDIRELAEKGKSGLLKRIAELTAKRKAAEERAALLEAQIRQQQQSSALEAKPLEIPEAIAKVNSVEELNKLYQSANDYIEWAEDVLFSSDHLGPDDIIVEDEGKKFTKREIKNYLVLARKNRDKFLPERLKQIKEAEQRKIQREALNAQMRREIKWLEGEDNDLRRRFEATIGDPIVQKIRKAVPEAEPILEYMVAHAVNSVYGRKLVDNPTSATPRIDPPMSTPSSSSADSSSPASREDKKLKEIASRFKKTGSEKDYEALRTAQLSIRRKIA